MTRTERALAVGAPFVAIAVVAMGLRVGAPDTTRVAQVFGAPAASAGTGLAWQVTAFEEQHGVRAPIAGAVLSVLVRAGDQRTRVVERTNADGVAEVLLPPQRAAPEEIAVLGALRGEPGSNSDVWASGPAAAPPTARPETAAIGAWMPYSRRTGPLQIDVATVGPRVAPGFAATLCVRVTNAATHAPAENVDVDVMDDPSLADTHGGRTDSAGWATIHATPVGLALALELAAHANDGTSSAWIGGLVAAPGGADIRMRARFSPDESPSIDVVAPSARGTEYVEIDDANGRAWAAALDLQGAPGEPRQVRLAPPKLARGLYWVIVSGAADGAEVWSPGTTMRPFFVAPSDDAALAMAAVGLDPIACGPRRDARETHDALWPCLATLSPPAARRWTALDGAPARRAAASRARDRGVGIALSALLVAALLEATLLARIGRAARAAFAEVDGPQPPRPRTSSWVVATCVALLGFALLAAFVTRDG